MRLHPQKQIKGPNYVLSDTGSCIFIVFIFFLCPWCVWSGLVILISLQFCCCSAGGHQRGGVGAEEGWCFSPPTDQLTANICQAAKAANMWNNERTQHLQRLTTVSRPFESCNMNHASVKRGDQETRRRVRRRLTRVTVGLKRRFCEHFLQTRAKNSGWC